MITTWSRRHCSARLRSNRTSSLSAVWGRSAAAVRAAKELRPDVIVMDFRLPDGTGADAAALIKADRAETEIVMLTGQATGAMLAQAIEAGCSGFVAKEGRFDELIDTIRSVVRGEVRMPRSLVESLGVLPAAARAIAGQ